MPTVNIQGIGTINFPDGMDHNSIVAAIENDILPNKARYGVKGRELSPPAARYGDPNAQPQSILEQAAPMIAHPVDALQGAGAAINPVPAMQDPQMYQKLGNEIVGGQGSAREAARQRLAARGSKLLTADPASPEAGQDLRDMFTWAVPLFGQAMASAGQQMESPKAETRARGGGAAIALTSGPSAINRTLGAAGGAMERSSGSVAPLSESIGAQLATKGKVLSPSQNLRVPKFATNSEGQLAELAKKYPQADIHDGGADFVVKAAQPTVPEAATQTSALDRLTGAVKGVGRSAIGAAAGTAIGGAFGHPGTGAEIGAAAPQAVAMVRSLIQSPLWKVASAPVKTLVGKAMQSQDFAAVTNAGARILSGQGLDDDFGHDPALHGLINSIPQQVQSDPVQLRQTLNDYDAVYVSGNGAAVQVPHHVLKQTFDALTSH